MTREQLEALKRELTEKAVGWISIKRLTQAEIDAYEAGYKQALGDLHARLRQHLEG